MMSLESFSPIYIPKNFKDLPFRPPDFSLAPQNCKCLPDIEKKFNRYAFMRVFSISWKSIR